MKRKISILLMAVMCIVSVTACSNEQENSYVESESLTESTDVEKEESFNVEKETEDEEESGDWDEMISVFSTIEWGEKRTSFEGTLYEESITLPITEEQMDKLFGSYSAHERFVENYYHRTDATKEDHKRSSFNDVLSMDMLVRIMEGNDIVSDYGNKFYSDREELLLYEPVLYINNYAGEPTTLKECYDNGWWFLYEDGSGYGCSNVLLLNNTYDTYLENVVDKFGTPHYIKYGWNSSKMTLEEQKADFEERIYTPVNAMCESITFEMIYVYDDYVILIQMNEYMYPEYDKHTTKVEAVTYLTKEMWEKYKELNPNNIFEFEPK